LKSELFIKAIILPIIVTIAIITIIFLYRGNTAADQIPLIQPPYNKLINVQLFADGLSFPTSMVFVDNKELLISEKDKGTVRVVSLDDGSVKEEPLLKVNVDAEGERGLLGIAAITKRNSTMNNNKDTITNSDTDVFVYYTDAEVSRNRIYKYRWNGDSLTNPQLILDLPTEPGPYHQGGKLKVSPDNKFLYAVVGDLNAPNGRLQNFEGGEELNDTSVILKINFNNNALSPRSNNIVDGIFCPSAYSTMANEKPSKRNYCYYAYGIRNSFGLAFDPVTGQLWDTENGEDSYDEINLVEPGFNSGWAQIMGPFDRNINNTIRASLVNFTSSHYADPAFSWRYPIGVTDIEFLNSTNLGSKYRNNIFVGDINNGNLYYFEVNDSRTGLVFDQTLYSSDDKLTDLVADDTNEGSAITFGTNFGRITDIETGPDGFLYVLSYEEGKIYRIIPS
jgi:aldose sugar dehydrogenase